MISINLHQTSFVWWLTANADQRRTRLSSYNVCLLVSTDNGIIDDAYLHNDVTVSQLWAIVSSQRVQATNSSARPDVSIGQSRGFQTVVRLIDGFPPPTPRHLIFVPSVRRWGACGSSNPPPRHLIFVPSVRRWKACGSSPPPSPHIRTFCEAVKSLRIIHPPPPPPSPHIRTFCEAVKSLWIIPPPVTSYSYLLWGGEELADHPPPPRHLIFVPSVRRRRACGSSIPPPPRHLIFVPSVRRWRACGSPPPPPRHLIFVPSVRRWRACVSTPPPPSPHIRTFCEAVKSLRIIPPPSPHIRTFCEAEKSLRIIHPPPPPPPSPHIRTFCEAEKSLRIIPPPPVTSYSYLLWGGEELADHPPPPPRHLIFVPSVRLRRACGSWLLRVRAPPPPRSPPAAPADWTQTHPRPAVWCRMKSAVVCHQNRHWGRTSSAGTARGWLPAQPG